MTSLILVPRCHPLNIKPFSYYNIFSRDFCVYFYIFLRDFLYSCYIFPRDFLSKAIIKGGHLQNFNLSDHLWAASSPRKRAFRLTFLEAGFGQFVSHGPAVPISFPPFLGDFTGHVQAFGIGAEFFQVNDAISILIAAIQSRHGLFHIGFIVLDFRINPFKLSFQGRQVIEVMIQHFFIIAFNPFSSTYTL